MRLFSHARAKINLSLAISGRRSDGYHEISSLVAFAGACDILSLEAAPSLSLNVSGATGESVGPSDDNLVLVAARAFAARFRGAKLGRFHLQKQLPIAAGIGGGSADAAAALRLLSRLNDMPHNSPVLFEVAQRIGADVPVCLDSVPRLMTGIGERLGAPLQLPLFYVVLVNPGIKLDTRAVFAAMGLQPGQPNFASPSPNLHSDLDMAQWVSALRRSANDMEDAACSLAPQIVAVLAVLSAARGVRLARMSGSGATCFGLFETRGAAVLAARVIKTYHPNWWVKASLLRG